MTTVLLLTGLLLGLLLTAVTVIQTCFLESLRLRPRQYPALDYFNERLQDSLGVSKEAGALAFSLWKHALLAVCAVPIYSVTGGAWETAGLALGFMLFAGYLIPQFLYRRIGGAWLGALTPLFRLLLLLARPLMSVLSFMRSIAELAGERPQTAESASDDVEALIEAGAEEGIIEEEDKKLIQTVIEFGDKTVREVMTPRPQVVAIGEEKPLEELRQMVISEQFSRIPVFRNSLDNIVGFVHVRDMFELDAAQRARRKVKDIMREIDAVPESKAVTALLREMQREGKHMVVVVNEYGNTAGIVTLEDLVEEILGEIRDEHEPGEDVTREAGGAFLVSGSYDVDHLPDLVEVRLQQSTESTTIGGLVTEWMGHVPSVGESIERDGLRLEVVAASETRVEKVRVSRVAVADDDGEHADV